MAVELPTGHAADPTLDAKDGDAATLDAGRSPLRGAIHRMGKRHATHR
jgi:hypothetical protein